MTPADTSNSTTTMPPSSQFHAKQHASGSPYSSCELSSRRLWLHHRLKLIVGLLLFTTLLLYREFQLQSTSLKPAVLSLEPSTNVRQRAWKRLSTPPHQADLDLLNAQLREPVDVLRWLAFQYELTNEKHNTAVTPVLQITSLGASGAVITDLLSRLQLLSKIPVVTIDTLHLFPETYQLYETVSKHYKPDIRFHVVSPSEVPPYQIGVTTASDRTKRRKDFDAAQEEPNLYKSDPEEYAELTKREPTVRVLHDYKAKAWMTGRRQSQGGERSHLKVLEWDWTGDSPVAGTGYLKVNPLAHWTWEQVWDYIRKHRVPYNPLYDQGFTSIGDVMTTKAVMDKSAGERSGRFIGLNKTECGMHEHLERVKRAQEIQRGNTPEDRYKQLQAEQFHKHKLLCSSCIEVDPSNFEELLVTPSDSNIHYVVEFYSPFCGSCQEFAPIYYRVAFRLKQEYALKVRAARFDVTEHDVSAKMKEQGFGIDETPTLFYVSPGKDPVRYTGDKNEQNIMDWVEEMQKGNA